MSCSDTATGGAPRRVLCPAARVISITNSTAAVSGLLRIGQHMMEPGDAAQPSAYCPSICPYVQYTLVLHPVRHRRLEPVRCMSLAAVRVHNGMRVAPALIAATTHTHPITPLDTAVCPSRHAISYHSRNMHALFTHTSAGKPAGNRKAPSLRKTATVSVPNPGSEQICKPPPISARCTRAMLRPTPMPE